MNLIEDIKQLIKDVDLSASEVKELEDFVDNYIGTAEDGYIPNVDYYNLHNSNLNPIWRKFKENAIFGTFINILKPHIHEGILALIN